MYKSVQNEVFLKKYKPDVGVAVVVCNWYIVA